MSARIAMARLPEMSTCAASAAQDRSTAAATTPAPNARTVSSGDSSVPVNRSTIAGRAKLAVSPSLRHIIDTSAPARCRLGRGETSTKGSLVEGLIRLTSRWGTGPKPVCRSPLAAGDGDRTTPLRAPVYPARAEPVALATVHRATVGGSVDGDGPRHG